jgi:hypothetical protein
MGAAVVTVFGLLAYSVVTTLPRLSTPPAGGYIPPTLEPLVASAARSPMATPPSATVISPTATAAPSPTPIPLSQIDTARVVNELSQIVAGVRDLPAVEQIPVSFPTPLEVTIGLLQRYEEEQPWEGLALYETLGLIPPLDPLPQPDVVAQASHISSLYLPEQREILLVTGRGPTTPDHELAVVHALARAIQDQHFDLQTITPCQATTDAELALRALTEGDPIVTAALYGEIGLEEEALDRLAHMAAGIQEPTYTPLEDDRAFQRLRLFPYREGAALVATMHGRGGWQEVNRAYAWPPCSTEQVLHPELAPSEALVQGVALPDLGPVLGEGWAVVREDTLGELLIALHLAEFITDDAVAWDAAGGWAGDSFVQWETDEGEMLLVWRIAWDDRDEAAAFEQVYTLLVPRFRVPALVVAQTPYRLTGQLWAGSAGAAYVGRAGRVTTVIWGPDLETVTAVAEYLP